MHGKKTFHSTTNYHGFKLGNGRYREFLFEVPPIVEHDDEEHKEVGAEPPGLARKSSATAAK